MAGIIVGWIAFNNDIHNDYWVLHNDGWQEHQLLIKNPGAFVSDLFYSPYTNKYGGFFNAVGSFWNDLRNNIIVKTIGIVDLLSRGNYYVNSLFFNTLCFFGQIAFYKLFRNIYPDKKYPIILGCFLLPSTLYFTSGVHKDLIVFTALAFYCLSLFSIVTTSVSAKKIIVFILSAVIILTFRNFLFIALIPASLSFLVAIKLKKKPSLSFVSIYTGLIILVMLFTAMFVSFNPLNIITQRQADFIQLETAHSQIPITRLEPTITSFAKNLPEALNHGLLRPYLWETNSFFSLLTAIEWMAYLILFFMAFLFYTRYQKNNAFLYFSFFLTIFMLIIIGYTIPNTNSIVRYRSLYLPLIITPLLCWAPIFKKKG
jgi:hypothetical protein